MKGYKKRGRPRKLVFAFCQSCGEEGRFPLPFPRKENCKRCSPFQGKTIHHESWGKK